MTGKSQGEAVNILRGARGLVKIIVQREEVLQSAQAPAVEVSCFRFYISTSFVVFFTPCDCSQKNRPDSVHRKEKRRYASKV